MLKESLISNKVNKIRRAMKEIRLHQPDTKATQIILKKKRNVTDLVFFRPAMVARKSCSFEVVLSNGPGKR